MAKDRLWKCSVRFCPTRAKRGFYRIPEHPTRRHAWIIACKFPMDVKKSASVCWTHFQKSDFKTEMDPQHVNELGMGLLELYAVPSLNLPEDAMEVDITG